MPKTKATFIEPMLLLGTEKLLARECDLEIVMNGGGHYAAGYAYTLHQRRKHLKLEGMCAVSVRLSMGCR